MTNLPRWNPFGPVTGMDLNVIADAIDGGSPGLITIRDLNGNATVQNGAIVTSSIASDPYVPISGARGTFMLDSLKGFQFWDKASRRVVFIDILTGNVVLGNSSSPATLTLTGGTIIAPILKSAVTVPVVGGTTGSWQLDATSGLRFWDLNGNLTFQLGMDGTTQTTTTNGADVIVAPLPAPARPTVVRTGLGGSTKYYYWVVAVNQYGDTVPGTMGQIKASNATLDGTHYHTVSWSLVPGATGYKVLVNKNSASVPVAGSPPTGGWIGGTLSSTTSSLVDNGGTRSAYTQVFSNPGGSFGTGILIPAAQVHAIGAAEFDGGDVNVYAMATPPLPTVAPVGATGTTSYSYHITPFNEAGFKITGSDTTIGNGNATLDDTNFNRITWTAVKGASYYIIVRAANTGGYVNGGIGNVAAYATLQFDDTGQDGSSIPAAVGGTTAGGNITADGIITAGSRIVASSYLKVPISTGGTYAPSSYGQVPVKLNETVLNGATASVTFSSIPQVYRTIWIQWYARGDSAVGGVALQVQVNGDVGSNYDFQYFDTTGTAANTDANDSASATTFMRLGSLTCANGTANSFSGGDIYFPNYSNGTQHSMARGQGGWVNGTYAVGNTKQYGAAGWYRVTGGISSVTLAPATGNFVTDSTFILWGLP